MTHLSQLAKNYPASGIRKMFDLAAQYDDVIKLTVGEPNFDTPNRIKEAAKTAIDEGLTHYSANAGILELRQAISENHPGYSPDEVMVTVGAMEAITLSLMATIDPRDEVLIPDPCFPNYFGQIMIAGGTPVPVPVYESNDFKVRAEDIEKAITPRTKGLLINSPSNPLGSVLEREDLEAIAEVARKHDLIVYSDEVYDQIVYDGKEFISIAKLPGMRERTLIINSLSKSYAMTGWRLGYVLGSKSIISNMPKLQEGIVSCVPTFIQIAAIEAIRNAREDANRMIEEYTRRRDILIDGLNNIPGISCKKSPGTFYAFANIKSFGKTSVEFAEELIREARVVVVPGSAFGEMGEGYIRLVFANSDDNLKEALQRIDRYIRSTY